MLNDGHATYTPGLSESRAGVSTYSAYDVLGNLWFVDGAGAAQTYYQDTTAFGSGSGLGIGGTEAGPFKFGGGNGCQVEADTGYVLMGHRYYDPRIGRFITQDPAGEGDNWYSYAGNSPTNEVDPEGLTPTVNIEGWSAVGTPGYADGAASGTAGAFDNFETSYTVTHTWIQDHERIDGVPTWADRPGSDTWTLNQVNEGPVAGDNIGNFIQAVAPYAPKRVKKVASVAAKFVAASASAKAAQAALKHYMEKAAASAAWRSMGDSTARSLTRSLGVEAAGTLGVAGLGVAAEGIASWSAGYDVGTAISNAPLGPGGQTVTDYWTDQLNDSGLWVQQHSSFGH